MRNTLKAALVLAMALFVGAASAQKAQAGLTAKIEKSKVNSTTYKVRLVATASHPGVGSVTYKSPWRYITKGKTCTHSQTMLAFRFSSSIRWSSNKLIGKVTAKVTILGKTFSYSRTVSVTVS